MKKYKSIFLYVGYIAVLLSAIFYPNHHTFAFVPTAVVGMGIGALCLLIYRLATPIEIEDTLRIKRFQIQIVISTLLYFGTAYLMYIKDHRWLISLLVAAIIDIVIAYRIPSKKTNN